MDSLDEFIPEKIKTFHPVYERGDEAWYPGCETSSLLLQADYIWEDMICLSKLYHPEESIFPKIEDSFDVNCLSKNLQLYENVETEITTYNHGFMNQCSKKYSLEGERYGLNIITRYIIIR